MSDATPYGDASRAVAVVLVHGVGDLTPGEIVNGMAKALANLGIAERSNNYDVPPTLAGRARSSNERDRKPDVMTELFAERLQAKDSGPIDLVEFHWSNRFPRITWRKPLRSLWLMGATLEQFPQLTIGDATPKWIRYLLRSIGLALRCAFLLLLLSSVAAFAEFLAHGRRPEDTVLDPKQLWQRGSYAQAIFVAWALGSLVVPVLMIVAITVLIPFAIARAIIGRPARGRTGVVVFSLLAYLGLAFGTVTIVAALQTILAAANGGVETAVDWKILAFGLAPIAIVMWWAATSVVQLARDVSNYLVSSDRELVQNELESLLDSLSASAHYRKIVILAHSLGSVVAVELLSRMINANKMAVRGLHLFTAGSPIRRLVARFLPDRMPPPAHIAKQWQESGASVRWCNLYRIADPVGQSLSRSTAGAVWYWLLRRQPPPAPIEDVLLRPALRPPFTHPDYFLDARAIHRILEIQ